MSKIKSTSSSFATYKQEDYTSKGVGLLVLGTVASQSFHTVTTKTDILRYSAFVVKVSAAHVRKFNKFGSEEVPDDMKKDVPSKVSTDKMMQLIGEGSVVPKAFNLGVEITNLLHPATADCFLFWIDTDKVKNLNFKDGEEVLVRTLGDSIILDKMARADLDSFEGVEHGKLLSQVSSRTDRHADGDKPLPGDDVQGVADDEWD